MSKLPENAKRILTTLKDIGWWYEDIAALVGVGRPTLMKYWHHPEQMTIGEYDFLVSQTTEKISELQGLVKEASNE